MIHGIYNIPTQLSEGAKLPEKAHHNDAAFDLCTLHGVVIGRGERRIVPTGVSVEIPEGCAGLILPRSGLAFKQGVTVLNAPGLIDPGYRGEIGVVLANFGDSIYMAGAGDRIAQLLIVPTTDVHFTSTNALSESVRGSGGFGSTGA